MTPARAPLPAPSTAWCAALLGLALLAPSAPAAAAVIEPAQSQIGFTLKTRWGQRLEGRFPVLDGEILTLADGRRQVRLSLSARDVEIVGHAGYTRMTRGRTFFDAERWPQVVFVSDPFDMALVRQGGALAGDLGIRGIHRRETFEIAPATCAEPGTGCAVVARGAVRRADYGLDRWRLAMSEVVLFSLRIRTRDGA